MATVLLDEETVKKVVRQVEFYFSDSNLPRDNFLKKTIDESGDGMVSLALICSFSRMRNHLALGDVKPEDVSEDTVKAVAEALRPSSLIKISEDGKKIGRTTELLQPEEVIEQSDVKTIAASPLEYDLKLEDVESYFGHLAKVDSVRLPRHVADKRVFCGTALIEFSNEEDAARVLKESLVYAGVELELKPKKEFDAERAKQAKEVANFRSQVSSDHKSSSNVEDNYPKGLIVAFTLKSMSTGGSAEQNVTDEPANGSGDVSKTDGEPAKENVTEEADQNLSKDVRDDGENPGENVEKENEEKVDEKTSLESEQKETEDSLKSFDNSIQKDGDKAAAEDSVKSSDSSVQKDGNKAAVEDSVKSSDSSIQKDGDKVAAEDKSTAAMYKDNKDVVLREDLKAIFKKFGIVKFVDFKIGAESGYIRFEEAGAAQKARAAAVLAEEGGLVVKNYIAILDPVTGEAEKEYWNLLRGNQGRHRDYMGNRGRGGKHNRGRKQFNGKHSRSGENDSASRPNKFQKVGAA